MLKILGKATSINVRKVLWTCAELGTEFEREDWGTGFQSTLEPGFLALNPNAQVPVIVDGDFVLWESNSIIRYLVMQYGRDDALYPADPKVRASVDRWLDWTLSTLQPAERPVFWGYVRTPEAKRHVKQLEADATEVEKLWRMLDAHLKGRDYLEGGTFTLADLVIAAYARRWYGIAELARPSLPDLERWYAQQSARAGFQRYVAHELT